MHLKKLEIFGFKSFADKTVLNFESGITAVVGPNGCGKSNIFDSIRWVLGEQSIKELRGSSKEDVIFNGTDKKPSLGFAEVSLTFSNESRRFPIEQDEVIITRKLFRSGESEYLLNKTIARLKDIQELLMGTGIGAEAYSLVQQGKVDLVVSAKPEERRMIFDEASGITKYKAKKREAMNKLNATDENLLRVNDITIEVKRQIASIERQATKAKKFKGEFDKLKALEMKFARYQMKHFSKRKKDADAHIEQLKKDEENISRELEELNIQLAEEINGLSAIDQQINAIHSEQIKLDGQVDLNNRQIGFNQERIDQIKLNDEKIANQKESLIERCRVQHEKIEQLSNELASLENTQAENEAVLKEKREGLTLLERFIEDARSKIKDDEEKILILTSQQVNVRNELTDIMKEVQGALARKKRLELENAKVLKEKEAIDQKIQNTSYQISSLNGTISQLQAKKNEQDQMVEDLTFSLSQLRDKIDNLEKQKLSLISQKDFIEKLHAQYQDIPDPIVEGRIIVSSPPLEHHTGILGKVIDVKALEGKKLETFKEGFAQSGTNELYEIICETKFIELDPQQIASKIIEISNDIEILSIEKEGLVNRLKTQQDQLKEVEMTMHEKEKEFSILEAQKGDILEEEKKLSSEIELLLLDVTEVDEILEVTRKKEDELNYKLDTINQELGWHQKDIKDKQALINIKVLEKEKLTISITQLESELGSAKDRLISQRENCKIFSNTLDSWLEEIKKIDDEVNNHADKKSQFEADIILLMEKIEEAKTSKESLSESISVYLNQKIESGERINGLRSRANEFEHTLDDIKQQLHNQALSDQKLSFNEQGIKDRLMQSYKINIDEILNTNIVLENNSAEEAKAPEAATVSDGFEGASEQPIVNFENMDQAVEPQTLLPEVQPQVVIIEEFEGEVNEEEVTDEIAKLKKRCDSYGNVNLVAIEEYEELKGRFEFLTKQQSDLLEAKSQLMSTIRKINRSTRQMFMDTFTKVSEEFRIYFRMLFGGGEAQLILLDPENVLESGIDIVARPPGKKLQNISLLSGGEKTLTAIALIFGVFKVNPSPFCVLDEIDAALDESNVGRFSYLLQDFSKIAQFIVITHNKKTISAADVMYGITMPETGISRIVSVKFAEKKNNVEELEVVAA